MEGVGQTEVAVIVGKLYGMKPKPGSMGKSTPLYNTGIVENEGKPVKVGEKGEIVVYAKRGETPALFKEYYRNPEATDNAWGFGKYHTGETAYMDDDGYYWYVGSNTQKAQRPQRALCFYHI